MGPRASDACAAAGDQDPLALEQVGLEHRYSYFLVSVKATPEATSLSISAAE